MISQIARRSALPTLCCALMMLVGCETTSSSDATGFMPNSTGHDSRPMTAEKPAPKPAAKPATAEKPAPKPAPKPATRSAGAGQQQVSMAYPTGDPNTSTVMIDKVLPTEVSVGEDFCYEIMVTNLSGNELSNVVVSDQINDIMNVSSSEPRMSGSGTWNLGNMKAGEVKTIKVCGEARTIGTITNCATIAYDQVICASINVVQPGLELVKSATREVLLCEMIEVKLVVRNPGSGTAKNVRISDPLPQGWTTADGKRSIDINVGDLAPGESRDYAVMCKASSTGSFDNVANATANGGLDARSGQTTTIVRQPDLTVSCDAPELRYLGRNAVATFTVKNDGDGVANNVILTDNFSGCTFVSASDGGRATGNTVTWDLGTMNPGATKTVSVTLTSAVPGFCNHEVTVNGDCSDADSCRTRTEYRGIPAILLEVVDVTDPVEVGTQTVYVITATNQGSAPDTNISIEAMLPNSQRFVSASGATNGTHRGGTVTFAALPRLGVGEKATWRVTIEAVEQADSRFKVVMNTDELTTSVEETEATNLYR